MSPRRLSWASRRPAVARAAGWIVWLVACGSKHAGPPPPPPPPVIADATPAPPPDSAAATPTGHLVWTEPSSAAFEVGVVEVATGRYHAMGMLLGTPTAVDMRDGAVLVRERRDDGTLAMAAVVFDRRDVGQLESRDGPPALAVSPDGRTWLTACPHPATPTANLCLAPADHPGSAGAAIDAGLAQPGVIGWHDEIVVGERTTAGYVIVVVDPTGASPPVELPPVPAVARPALSSNGRSLAWLEPAGATLALAVARVAALASPRRYDVGAIAAADCAFADRDRRVVCASTAAAPTAGSRSTLWSVELATGTGTALATDVVSGPVIAPDGQWVAYGAAGDPRARLLVTPVDRALPVELPVPVRGAFVRPVAWSC